MLFSDLMHGLAKVKGERFPAIARKNHDDFRQAFFGIFEKDLEEKDRAQVLMAGSVLPPPRFPHNVNR